MRVSLISLCLIFLYVCLYKYQSLSSSTHFVSLLLHQLPRSLVVYTSEPFCAEVSLRGHQRRSSSGEHLLVLILFTSSNSHCPHTTCQNITHKISGFDSLGIDVQRDGTDRQEIAQCTCTHSYFPAGSNIFTRRTGTNTRTHKNAHTLMV